MREQEIFKRSGLRLDEILRRGETGSQQSFAQPLVLVGGKYVLAEMQVVILVIYQPERKHLVVFSFAAFNLQEIRRMPAGFRRCRTRL